MNGVSLAHKVAILGTNPTPSATMLFAAEEPPFYPPLTNVSGLMRSYFMSKKHIHRGSDFRDFLNEQGIQDEVEARALKQALRLQRVSHLDKNKRAHLDHFMSKRQKDGAPARMVYQQRQQRMRG